jgi:hypothetical protein
MLLLHLQASTWILSWFPRMTNAALTNSPIHYSHLFQYTWQIFPWLLCIHQCSTTEFTLFSTKQETLHSVILPLSELSNLLHASHIQPASWFWTVWEIFQPFLEISVNALLLLEKGGGSHQTKFMKNARNILCNFSTDSMTINNLQSMESVWLYDHIQYWYNLAT